MISVLQIVVIIAAIAFFAYVISLVAKNRMLLKYSLLWMLLTVIAAICAIFPTPIYRLSTLFGFETPSNFIFFMGLLLLMAICLSLSVIVSGQTIKIKNLVQEQALLQKRLEDFKAQNDEQ